MTKVFIIYYSMYGHVRTMANAVKEGINSVDGCEATLFQVPEILPQEVLEKMHAPPKSEDPVITASQLTDCDALVLGFPTRFGMMASQFKAFLDSTGSLWQKAVAAWLQVTFFTSTATQGGGQETTIMTALTQAVHHGMIYVPLGYTAGPKMFSLDAPQGGGPWGAGTFAGADGSRQPSENELAIATSQGSYFAGKAKLLTA
eukprot:jgi/Ulvmu1/9131/UM005_0227.1